jgi:hypothetical protein
MEPKSTYKSCQLVIPSVVEGSIRISLGRRPIRIFDSCALIFYIKKRNEPAL